VSRVLITGGGGFIGAHLGRFLADRDHEVDLVDDLSRGRLDADLEALQERPNVRLLERDLLAPDALADLSADYGLIFHLAAIVGVANVLDAPDRVLRRNVELLVAALEVAARQDDLQRFVFASTSEVYAGTLALGTLPLPTPEDAPLTVPDPRLPRTSYMLSKIFGEAMSFQSGVPVTVVRPHNVYGPRMGLAHVIPELLQRAHSTPDGGSLGVYSVEHRRTFCHVSDAIEMISRAAEAPEGVGESLNVGKQEPEISIGDLAELIVEVVGRRLEIEPLEPHPGSPARRCPDMTKTTEVTGYVAQMSVEDGVRDTYDWYRRNAFEAPG
jgi:nucleoside-diphosphate-sugar epimerase